MTPRASSGPPKMAVFWKVTTYSGMKTVSNPNAMSWKKNPSRHIGKGLFQGDIKAFAQQDVGCLKNRLLAEFFHKSLIESYPTSYCAGELSAKWQNSK